MNVNNDESIYDTFSEIYDYFYQHTEDIEFYSRMAEKYGDPILELACGTGRVLLELAKNGFRITGLDISESMLNILRKKLEKLEESVRSNIEIVKEDMRNFDLKKTFQLIIMPFSSIVHILTVDDALKTFRRVYQHLRDTGVFIFDTFDPKLEYLIQRTRKDFDIRDVNGGKIVLWENTKYDLTNHFIFVKRYGFVKINDTKKEFIWETKLRYWFKTELELLLRMAGFNNIKTHGGFNLEPYSYEKGRIIIIASKKDKAL
ncbi:MAG: class I SAM-dependent methyltransferase [Candidatus Asgardarchaeia archaeon]